MSRLATRACVLAALLGLAPTIVRAQGEPSARERSFGDRLAARLDADAARVERVEQGGGRGVRVELPGVTAERLCFRDPAEAEAYARGLADDAPGLVEVRGNQVLVARGSRLADPAAADAAREAGWDVLPAPATAPSVSRALGRPALQPTSILPLGEETTGGGDTYGAVEILRHRLLGEELRQLGPGRRPASPAAATEAPYRGAAGVERALATASGVTIGEHQRGRVLPAYEALSAYDRYAFDELLTAHADRPEVRDQLLKALAASSPVSDIAWLAEQLAPHDAAWIDDNTRLTSEAGVGLRQQFSDSCVPTVAQALRAEYDPVYALRTRQANGDVASVDENDPYAVNDALAREQQELLERTYTGELTAAHGDFGVAAPRATVGYGPGMGTHFDQILDSMAPATGLEYRHVGDYDHPVSADTAISTLREHVSRGRAVPLAITSNDYNGGHAVMATSMRTAQGGEAEFLIYDPWGGQSTWVSEQQIRSSQLNVFGLNRVWFVLEPRS